MRYRLVFDKKYRVSGRYPVNMNGSIVIFYDGVAYTNNLGTVDYAKKLRYIAKVEEVSQPVVVETVLPEEPVVEDMPVSEPEPEPVVEPEPEAIADSEVATGDEITSETVISLYQKLGTWGAVASHLDMTTAQLRKLRGELGLI